MSDSAFAVTHYAFSSGAGRTSDGNGSHASTLKSPSYTKSVSWQHYPGCTHSQQSMVDTFRASLFDNQDITVADQQIQALPYSTMYLRLNEGQRIFVVLGYIEQEQSKWLSQDNAMLVTHNGRLLKTVKLNNNLLEVTNSGQDPLRNALAIKDGSRWTRDILWSEDNHFRSATLSSTFSFAGLETLNIAGRNVLCNVWQEEVTSTRPEKQWQNTFWVDSATGQVRQSRQMLGAGVIPVEMTFLKPAP
ncbi:gfcB_1 [Escherichia coli]|nr:gfcB_1 [Escherichia coli]